MNDIGYTFDPWPTGFACVEDKDVRQGKPKLLLIENFDDLRKLFKEGGLAPWVNNREIYKSYDEFAEITIEQTIIHETLHYVLYNLEGEESFKKLDNIDRIPLGNKYLRE